jgi:hypothetical protein
VGAALQFAEKLAFVGPTVKERPFKGPRKPLKINLGFSPRRRFFFDQLRFSAYCLAAEPGASYFLE